MPPLLVRGMHGLGDNLHQRAILRQLMCRHDVWLESSWLAPYHDLIADGLKVIHKPTALRTQSKNAKREAAGFCTTRPPQGRQEIGVWYCPEDVRSAGSVLAAMCRATGCDYASADFRLPVPLAWQAKADALIAGWEPTKPILIYRPLVERTEWGGCAARNPDHAAYARLYAEIRDRFFVVSIADLVPNVEWMTGLAVEVDVRLHHGELEFETLAALIARAAMVLCSPGFAVMLAQAVSTPVACVFGGYENSKSFQGGARYSAYLGIDPIQPCSCWRHDHACRKAIDIADASRRIAAFAADAAARSAVAA